MTDCVSPAPALSLFWEFGNASQTLVFWEFGKRAQTMTSPSLAITITVRTELNLDFIDMELVSGRSATAPASGWLRELCDVPSTSKPRCADFKLYKAAPS